MQALAVQCLAVLLPLFPFGKRTDFNPIIERGFGFFALVAGFVFMGFDV